MDTTDSAARRNGRMSWIPGASSLGELLGLRQPLATRVNTLRNDAVAGTPGRVAALIDARVEQLLGGAGSLDSLAPLSAAEQAVVAVVEQFVLDAHGIDDAMMAELGRHYTAPEQVSMLFYLAMADGFGKFTRTFGVESAAGPNAASGRA